MPWRYFPENQKYTSSFPNISTERNWFSTGISNFLFRLQLWVGVLNAEKTPTCAKHESTFQISKGLISAPHTSGKADDMNKGSWRSDKSPVEKELKFRRNMFPPRGCPSDLALLGCLRFISLFVFNVTLQMMLLVLTQSLHQASFNLNLRNLHQFSFP